MLDASRGPALRGSVLLTTLWLGGCASMAGHLADVGVSDPAAARASIHAAPAQVTPEQNAPAARGLPKAERDSAPGQALIAHALALEGRPYRYGGTSAETGFDCSGFVMSVFRDFGVRLPRDARSMAAALPEVPKDTRRPGDLVFFNTRKRPYSHVGIYLGDDLFVHATSSATRRVMVSDMTDLYWRKRFDGVRRVPAGSDLARR